MTSVGGSTLGSVRGQIRIDAKQAIAEYAAVRAANAATRTELGAASVAFAKVGVVALAAAAPIALLFSKAVSAAADFQKKIDYFGAVTDASQADMQAVADKAISMSKTTVYSAEQMADAFVEFGKAGISTKDILGGVADATANLAQAADLNIGDASNIIVAAMSTFNLGAKDAIHIADQMAGAANSSIIDVQDLATSLKYAGGIAAATKIPFESVVTAIALLGNAGIKGSTAGTSLRQVMVSLVSQTKPATKVLTDLGIITKNGTNLFIDQAGHLKDLSTVFQILQDHTRGLTDAQKLSATKTIFNSRALASANILMRDGASGFAAMSKQIGNVTALDVAHKRLDNLAGDMTHFKNSIQTMLIQVGGPLQNFARDIIQFLTKMVQWFGNLSPTWQKIIIYGLGVAGIFFTIVGVLSLMISLVLKTIMVYRDLKAAMILVRAATIAFSESFMAAGAALLTNPIFLVIAGITLLVVAFIYCWNHFAGFRDFFKQAWADIKGFFLAAWAVINNVFKWIVSAAQAGWNLFYKYWIKPQIEAVQAIIGAFKAVYNAIAGAITTIINFVKIHWKLLLALFLGPLGLIIDAITTHWDWIVKTTKSFFNLIAGVFKTALNFWVSLFMGVFNTIKNIFTTAFNFWMTITRTALNLLETIFTTAWNAISTAVRAAWNAISSFFSTIWAGITAIFSAALNFLEAMLRSVWNIIGGPLRKFWNSISKFFSALWTGIAKIFTGAWNTISAFMSKVFGSIGHYVSDAATGIWNGIQAIVGKVWDSINGVLTSVIKAISGLYNAALTVGKNIATGIWNGIAGMADWLWKKVSSFVKSLWNNVLGFFGIHSPSTKGIDAGMNIVKGLANGITKNQHLAVNAVTGMNKAMMDANTASLNAPKNPLVTAGLMNLQASINATSKAALGTTPVQGSITNKGVTVDKLIVNNPTPEKMTTSLPKTIRKMNYLTVGPAR